MAPSTGGRDSANGLTMRPDHRPPRGQTRSPCTQTTDRAEAERSPEDLADLVYELLDAHHDTSRLAAQLTGDGQWQAHLAYLRDLQRTGRAMLAQATARERT
jgi:hypothetical protein